MASFRKQNVEEDFESKAYESEEEYDEQDYLPPQALISDQFNVPEHLSHAISRKYFVDMHGSLVDLAVDSSKRTWRPQENRMFQSTSRYAANATPTRFRQGDIENAMLIGARINYVHSTLPFPVGVRIKGITGNTYIHNGKRYAYVIHKNQGATMVNDVIATTKPQLHSSFVKEYGASLTPEKLKECVEPMNGKSYQLVQVDSPVGEIMYKNQQKLHMDLTNAVIDLKDEDEVDETTGEVKTSRYYKVDRELVDNFLNQMQLQIERSVPKINLADLQVEIERLDGEPFDSKKRVCEMYAQKEKQDAALLLPRDVQLTLELNYALESPN